jgi:hypothetical protein
MADVMRCKVEGCGFVAFHIQMSGHFKLRHPDLNYNQNTEILMNSDADLKQYGFRPSIEYYRAKLQGKDVTPWQFEKRETASQ